MPEPADSLQPFSALDRKEVAAMLDTLRRQPNKVQRPLLLGAAAILGLLYLLDVYWLIPLVVGLLLLGLAAVINWAIHAHLKEVRSDFEKGIKRVVRGQVTRKWMLKANTQGRDESDVSAQDRHYLQIDGQDIHVPKAIHDRHEAGERIVLHILPTPKLVFRAEPWTSY